MSADILALLLRLSIGGSAALLALLALRRPLRRLCGAEVAYAAWLAVPLVLCAMLLPAPSVPMPALAPVQVTAGAAASLAATTGPDPRALLVVLWLAGAVLTLAGFVRQQRRHLRSLGRLVPRAGGQVWQSNARFAGPALVAGWPSRIVLPVDFRRRHDAAERRLILAHEAVHRARGDVWVNAFVAALRVLGWFNPLVHFAAARFRLDQELACDAAVMARFPRMRRRYADAMLKAQLAGQPRPAFDLPVGCGWPADTTLKERILMLQQSRPPRSIRLLGLLLVAAAALGGAWTAWASQAPRLVTPAASASPFLDANLRMVIGGADESVRVIHPLDSPFVIADGAWRAEFIATSLAPDRIALQGTISENGRRLASPQVHARPGEPFAIAVDGHGGSAFRIEGTLALSDAAPPAPPAPPTPPAPPAMAVPPAPPAPPPPPAPPAAPPSVSTAASYRALQPAPYPPAALAAHTEGTVFVKARVGADGRVRDAWVDPATAAAAASAFGEVAVGAVRTWTFEPATAGGKPVAGEVIVPIRFALPGDGAGPAVAPPGALDTITVRPAPAH